MKLLHLPENSSMSFQPIFRRVCMFSRLRLSLALLLIVALPGCSAVMHASRPDPVNINNLAIYWQN
jgi:hypothetical protein